MFGYYVSPHDVKFKEALEKRKEEERRRLKKEKRLKKQAEDLERLKMEALKQAEEQDKLHGKNIMEVKEFIPKD